MGTHYSPSQDPQRLHTWCVAAATEIEVTIPDTPVILCYSGMSGIGMATALMMELTRRKVNVGMIYVRKEKEDSHGGRVEVENVVTDRMDKAALIFVDDFISLGGTIRRVQQGIYDNPSRVGALFSQRKIDYIIENAAMLKAPESRWLAACKTKAQQTQERIAAKADAVLKEMTKEKDRVAAKPKVSNRTPPANGKAVAKLDRKFALHRCSPRRIKSASKRRR